MPKTPKIDDRQKNRNRSRLIPKNDRAFSYTPEVQNIDLLNLAYFCRNCFSKWYVSAAKEHNIDIDYEQAREIIYGMPFSEYKSKHQHKAS